MKHDPEWAENVLWVILVMILATLVIWLSYEIGIKLLPLIFGAQP